MRVAAKHYAPTIFDGIRSTALHNSQFIVPVYRLVASHEKAGIVS